jgi:hypothetical protein
MTTPTESQTPLTDAEFAARPILDTQNYCDAVSTKFARQLETTLTAALAENQILKDKLETELAEAKEEAESEKRWAAEYHAKLTEVTRERDALRQVQSFRNTKDKSHMTLALENDQFAEQNRALREDKERLDWLEEVGRVRGEDQFWQWIMTNSFPYKWGELPTTLRSAIDAALALNPKNPE